MSEQKYVYLLIRHRYGIQYETVCAYMDVTMAHNVKADMNESNASLINGWKYEVDAVELEDSY